MGWLRPSIFLCLGLLITGCAEKKVSVGLFPLDDHPLVDYYAPSEAESTYHYLLYTMYRLQGDDTLALEHFQRSIGASRNPSAEALAELSALYSLYDDQQRAIALLQQAISINPDDPSLYKLLSLYYYQEYDFLRAREAMARVIQLGESRGEDVLFYAEILEKIGDYNGVIQTLLQLQSEQTDNYVAYYSLGIAYSRMHEYDLAIANIRQAMDIRGGDTLAYRFMLGRVLLEQGNVQGAMETYESLYLDALAQSPQIAMGYAMRIIDETHIKQHFSQSIDFSKRLMQDNPEWLWAVDACILNHYAARTSGVAQCIEGVELPRESTAYHSHTIYRFLIHESQDDELHLRQQILQPELQPAIVRSIKAYLEIDSRFKRHENAMRLLPILQILSENEIEALNMAITVASIINDKHMQLELTQQLYDRYPDTTSIQQLAWSYYEQGDFTKAVEILTPYAQRSDAPASLLNFIGYLMVDKRIQVQIGGNYIRRAIELESNNPYYLDSLAWFYYRTRDYVNAKIYIERAMELLKEQEPETDDAVIFEHAGDIMQRLGSPYTAFSYYARSYAFREDPQVFSKMEAIRNAIDSAR